MSETPPRAGRGRRRGPRVALPLSRRQKPWAIGLIVVLLWIVGLKAFRYEADGIVPFVANSPLMSFFYADGESYRAHKNPEGVLNAQNRSLARSKPNL